MTPPAIQLDDVHKSFRIYHRRHDTLKEAILRRGRSDYETVPVLDGVDLDIPEGQSIAIVGRNGAGKSTLLKVVSGLIPPDRGEVTVRGRVSTLLELGAGFAGEYSGAENVFLYGALMGLGRRFIQERFDEIVEFSGIAQQIDNPVKTYSSGQYMRLAFAVAVHVDPDILIIDEVLAVGDQAFQQKCFDRAQDLRRRGKTIVLVSHDMGAVERFCDRAIWIDGGKVKADGTAADVTRLYLDHMHFSAVRGETAASSPVRVQTLRVLNRAGQAEALKSGEPARVVFDLGADTAIANTNLAVRFLNQEGICVLAVTTRHFGPVDIPAGGREIACEIEQLSLAPGSYRLDVVVGSEAGTVLSAAHEAAMVSVLGTPAEGLLAVPFRWDIPAGARADSPAARPGG
ncbi:MAG: ABC transporter ATP-binding protein [Candidatus Dormibacteria bacterium]